MQPISTVDIKYVLKIAYEWQVKNKAIIQQYISPFYLNLKYRYLSIKLNANNMPNYQMGSKTLKESMVRDYDYGFKTAQCLYRYCRFTKL